MNYQFLNADQLEQLVRKGQPGKDYAVVDVRGPSLLPHSRDLLDRADPLSRPQTTTTAAATSLCVATGLVSTTSLPRPKLTHTHMQGAIRAPSEQRTEQTVQDLVQQLKDGACATRSPSLVRNPARWH